MDDVSRALGRIEAKLDEVLSAQAEVKKDLGANEARIDDLEESRTYLKGGIAVISTLVLVIAGLVIDVMRIF